MIVCEVYYSAKPGMRDELMKIAQVNVDASRKEKGNIAYTHYPSMENDTGMFVFELWETAKDLEAHIHSEHYLEFSRKRKDLMQEDSYRFKEYEATLIREGSKIASWNW